MQRWLRTGQYVLGFLLFLVVWWGGSFLAGPLILPPPHDVAAYLVSPGVVKDFFRQIALTSARGILGFSLAWMVALPLGFLMGRKVVGERIGFLPIFLLQSAPPLFWVTPLVLVLGTDGLVAPAVAFLVSLPLLVVHTANAVKAIPEHERYVFAIYAPRPLVVFRELYLPHLIPALKSNIHLGVLVAIKAAMLAEWFAAQNGFGRTIRLHYQFFAMTEFVSWALMFLLVVGGLSLILKGFLERFLPGYRSTPGSSGLLEGHQGIMAPPISKDAGPLVVKDLSFGYRRQSLFSGVSFQVTCDRPLVLHGPSGCGKTTLLQCVAGLKRMWSGEVYAGDSIGLIFQDDALLAHRDALGNVLLPAFPGISDQHIAKAQGILRQWGLEDAADLFPHELSGGMRKRLAMAREWFFESSVLLLDEPFVNLDREARQALWSSLFERLQERRIPAVIVTHYPEELAGFDAEVVSWEDLVGNEAMI